MTVAEFLALVNDIEASDPVACSLTVGRSRRDGSISAVLEPVKMVYLAGKVDALLNLLGATPAALAATMDLMEDRGAGKTLQTFTDLWGLYAKNGGERQSQTDFLNITPLL